jgi:hypothetical protein
MKVRRENCRECRRVMVTGDAGMPYLVTDADRWYINYSICLIPLIWLRGLRTRAVC